MMMLENEENLLLPKLLFLFFLIRDILNKPHNRISHKTFKGIASVKSVFSLLLIPLNGTRLCGNNGRSIFFGASLYGAHFFNALNLPLDGGRV